MACCIAWIANGASPHGTQLIAMSVMPQFLAAANIFASGGIGKLRRRRLMPNADGIDQIRYCGYGGSRGAMRGLGMAASYWEIAPREAISRSSASRADAGEMAIIRLARSPGAQPRRSAAPCSVMTTPASLLAVETGPEG